jgi:hypothetical protein
MEKCPKCKKHYLKLEVHHINKNHEDNRKENLLKICPNCHYRLFHRENKNKKWRRLMEKNKRQRTMSINNTKIDRKQMNTSVTMRVSAELVSIFDILRKEYESEFYGIISYTDLSKLLARKIREKNIKL